MRIIIFSRYYYCDIINFKNNVEKETQHVLALHALISLQDGNTINAKK